MVRGPPVAMLVGVAVLLHRLQGSHAGGKTPPPSDKKKGTTQAGKGAPEPVIVPVGERYTEDVISVFQEVSALALRGNKKEVWRELCGKQEAAAQQGLCLKLEAADQHELCLKQEASRSSAVSRGGCLNIGQKFFAKFIAEEGERYTDASVAKVVQEVRLSIPKLMREYHERAYWDAQKQHTEEMTGIYWAYLDLNKDGDLRPEELEEACRRVLATPGDAFPALQEEEPPLRDPVSDEAAALAALKFTCSPCSHGLDGDRSYHSGLTRFRDNGLRC